MKRSIQLFMGCAALLPVLADAAQSADAPALPVAQIVEKNIAARGGLSAWHGVRTLSWSGKLEAGGNNRPTLAVPSADARHTALPSRSQEQAQLPFVMELERPRKSHLEIEFAGQTAVQTYDGTQGWKVRPFLNRHEVEPYSKAELASAAAQDDLDGPLIDYAAKGTAVSLDGRETIDGHDTYKLTLTFKDRHVRHVWIDAQTFLEFREEGEPRRLDGKLHPVWVYLRDYRTVSGVTVPTVYETRVQGVSSTEKINIEKVVVNPSVPESHFGKPG
jgi:hypothetical protein